MDEEQRRVLRDEVARTVMGWRCDSVTWAYSGSTNCWLGADQVAVVTQHAWRPDEDDQQNLSVVDRMLELGFDCAAEFAAEESVVAFSRAGEEGAPICSADRRIAVLLAAVAILR